MLAAFDVGVRQFVDEDYLRSTRQNGIHVHLLECRAFVLDNSSWNRLELRGELNHSLSAMRLDNANKDIFATTLATDALAQHVVSLAHAGGVSQKELEDTLLFLWDRLFQPLLWRFRHKKVVPADYR